MSFWTPYWDTIDYMRNNMGASYDEIITITREVFEGKIQLKVLYQIATGSEYLKKPMLEMLRIEQQIQ